MILASLLLDVLLLGSLPHQLVDVGGGLLELVVNIKHQVLDSANHA